MDDEHVNENAVQEEDYDEESCNDEQEESNQDKMDPNEIYNDDDVPIKVDCPNVQTVDNESNTIKEYKEEY